MSTGCFEEVERNRVSLNHIVDLIRLMFNYN